MLASLRSFKLVKPQCLLKVQPPRRWNSSSGLKIITKTRSIKTKFGILVGTSLLVPVVWYLQADKQEKRKARVTFEGIGRFLR